MTENNYSWNQTLKFSWGHIIAFVALVFISYVTYMGDFYKNGGDFTSSAIKVLIVDIALLVTFIGAQIYKGTDEKFNRSIIIERILICLCPIAFLWAMLPYNHFWTVFSSRDKIESGFSSSIEKSKQMFENYEQYTTARIAAYDKLLQNVIVNKGKDKATYVKAGFNGTNDVTRKQIYMETLKLQLQSQNTDSLKNSAAKWINDANQGATVWNAFLIGNIDKISDAIEGWNKVLTEVSQPVLSNEPDSTKPFDADMTSCDAVKSELKQLQSMYTQSFGVSLNTVWTGLILFLMLMFPYFLQKRNTRATGLYSLLPVTSGQRVKKEEPRSDNDSQNVDTSTDTDIYGGTF
jgi:hypothetical protein